MNTDMISKILGLGKKINISSIVSNTNKTLNICKKAVPVYKEIRPYIRKEKNLFKQKKEPLIDDIKESRPIKLNNESTYNDNLTFFQ